MRLFYFLTFVSILVAGSCNFINPVEKTPTFIHIDSFQFTANPEMGSASHKITNIRISLDNEVIGVFDLPANIPILMDKPGVLGMTPGIDYSGLTDIQITYPFYTSDTITINPNPGKTQNITPTTGYYNDTTFNKLFEDFEVTSSFGLITGDDSIVRTQNPGEVFEGKYSGKITINASADKSELALLNFFGAPSQCFLELNYKGNVPIEIGMQTTDGENLLYYYGLNPSDNWKKVYIGLQDFIVQYPNKLYVLVIKTTPKNATGGYVLLDNIKILSRK
jgi:arginine repressor